MDHDIQDLVRAERILEAAEIASQRGDARTACDLFERACSWSRAAREALRVDDPQRALLLAVEGRDEALAVEALPAVAAAPGRGERVARQLERRSQDAWAARVHEACGRRSDAARTWEKAGEAVHAARLLEDDRDPVGAARVLEAAMRRQPARWELHVALGALLLRYGKAEGAARAVQKVPQDAPERRAALTHLLSALSLLGLVQARGEAEHELERLGGPISEEARASSKAPAVTRLFGRYEVVREVASSASARVVECIDAVRGERVAVKILAAYDVMGAGRDALTRFEREVRVLGGLEHPNVVPLRDYLPEGPALVLAWMSGGTLESRMTEASLAPSRAVEIACAVLSALGEAHRLGVLHRDIKPANVLFDDAGVARLADFGVAHLGDLTTTATAGVFGTLAYMSPEQREGRPATVQSDLYGVGVLLFEMLTRERPVPDEVPRLRPSGVHRDLDRRHDEAVLRLLARDRADRPGDAFAARRELLGLTWAETIESAAPRPPAEPASVRPAVGRLGLLEDGRTLDRFVGRIVERVTLNDRALARARAFARAAHRGLQGILRVDRAGGEIWIEARKGEPLARSLSREEARALGAALDALHGAGSAHGNVDREHVFMTSDGPTLLFTPDAEPTATADLDRLALSRLQSNLST